jgi:hypothetical protein
MIDRIGDTGGFRYGSGDEDGRKICDCLLCVLMMVTSVALKSWGGGMKTTVERTEFP